MYIASSDIIKGWADRTRCIMCSHKEDEGHILPAGKYYPSKRWLFHYQDTHGIPLELVYEWLYKSCYTLNGRNLLDIVYRGLE